MHSLQPGVILALLPLLTSALPASTSNVVSYPNYAPSIGKRQSSDTCPAIDTPNLGSYTPDLPSQISSVELPKPSYSNRIARYVLSGDDDDQIEDPSPSTGGKKRDLELVERSGGKKRLFEDPNYRQIALQTGLLMLDAANPGMLGLLGNLANSLPAYTGSGGSWWDGEHILELSQLTYFFNTWITGNQAPPGAAQATDWASMWTHFTTCPNAKDAMTGALNSNLNLIGLSSEINGLKRVLMAGQNAGIRTWDAVTAKGLQQYLSVVENNYFAVAQSVGNLINMAAGGQWFQQPWSMTGSPGYFFVNYATFVLTRAVNNVKALASSAGGDAGYTHYNLPPGGGGGSSGGAGGAAGCGITC